MPANGAAVLARPHTHIKLHGDLLWLDSRIPTCPCTHTEASRRRSVVAGAGVADCKRRAGQEDIAYVSVLIHAMPGSSKFTYLVCDAFENATVSNRVTESAVPACVDLQRRSCLLSIGMQPFLHLCLCTAQHCCRCCHDSSHSSSRHLGA